MIGHNTDPAVSFAILRDACVRNYISSPLPEKCHDLLIP